MFGKKKFSRLTIEDLEKEAEEGHTPAKKELAKRLLEGDGVEKNETKAVSLLEECVKEGSSDAMWLLAKCCALGYGTEHDAERAEMLIEKPAVHGNKGARFLMEHALEWKQQNRIDLSGLRTISR